MKKVFVLIVCIMMSCVGAVYGLDANSSTKDLCKAVDDRMDQLTQRREALEKSFYSMRAELRKLLTTDGSSEANAALPNNLIKFLKGRVLSVNNKWDFILIDLGKMNAVTLGKTNRQVSVALPRKLKMDVVRDNQFIGTVSVTRVNENTAVCDFIVMKDGSRPQVGDVVCVSITPEAEDDEYDAGTEAVQDGAADDPEE